MPRHCLLAAEREIFFGHLDAVRCAQTEEQLTQADNVALSYQVNLAATSLKLTFGRKCQGVDLIK